VVEAKLFEKRCIWYVEMGEEKSKWEQEMRGYESACRASRGRYGHLERRGYDLGHWRKEHPTFDIRLARLCV